MLKAHYLIFPANALSAHSPWRRGLDMDTEEHSDVTNWNGGVEEPASSAQHLSETGTRWAAVSEHLRSYVSAWSASPAMWPG